MVMNPLATAWVAKLRSGEIGQLRNKLTNLEGTEMCCMGVLCQVAGLPRDRTMFQGLDGDTHSAFAPLTLTYSIGLSETDVTELVNNNDFDRWDFHQIADRIEEMLA